MQVDGINFFDRPSPGESLTVEPKSRAYERPPEMSDLADILGYYVDVMASAEFIDNIVQLLRLKCPVEVVVNAITMQNVIEGKHSMHTRMIISPLLHEYLKLLATQAKIEYVDNLDSRITHKGKDKNNRIAIDIEKEIAKTVSNPKQDDGGVELMRQTADMLQGEEEEMPIMDNEEAEVMDEEPRVEGEEELEMPPTPMRTGLMARRGE